MFRGAPVTAPRQVEYKGRSLAQGPTHAGASAVPAPLETLRGLKLFAGLPAEAVAAVATQASLRVFPAGTIVLRQGEVSDALHVIVAGRAREERLQPRSTSPLVLIELGPGDLMGELGVLLHQPRSATVTAVQDTTTLELRGATLAGLMAQHPEISAALLRALALRLIRTDQLIARTLERAERAESASQHRLRRVKELIPIAEQADSLVRHLHEEVAKLRRAERGLSDITYSLGICLGDAETASSRVRGLLNELQDLAEALERMQR